MSLSNKAMLVTLNVTAWSPRRHDKTASQEVADNHGAQVERAGRFNKNLIDVKAPEWVAVRKLADEARAKHYELTSPWLNDGSRILASDLYFTYTEAMDTIGRHLKDAVADFVAAFPSLQSEARRELNGLYRDADYPSTEMLREKFAFKVRVLPLPDDGDWRAKVGADEEKVIKAQIRAELEDASNAVLRDLWGRLFEKVDNMATRLSTVNDNGTAIFKDSLVGNIRDLCDILPAMNITNDPTLAAMTKEVQRKLTAVEPDDLRSDTKARAKVARDAKAIMEKMKGLMG